MWRTADPHNSRRSRVRPAARSRKARSTPGSSGDVSASSGLVQHHEQGLLGGQLGKSVERVVPVRVGPGEQVPKLVRSRVVHLPGQAPAEWSGCYGAPAAAGRIGLPVLSLRPVTDRGGGPTGERQRG